MSRWSAKRWTVALVVTFVVALVTGIPTGIISTSFYTRMTPVLWWNYPVWAVTAVLAGLLAATYASKDDGRTGGVSGRVGAGSVLSALAVGCPICNKVVVALLGVSGALGIWAPLQPLIGLASIALLGGALYLRLRTPRVCKIPAASDNATLVVAKGNAPQTFQEFAGRSESQGSEDRSR